jgi:hypothetical protein
MEYKYKGRLPAVILIKKDLQMIRPGEVVNLPSAPTPFFTPIRKPPTKPTPPKKRKPKASKKVTQEETINASST